MESNYLLKDHLGSISKVVATSGVTPLKFSAFGQRATTSWGGVLSTSFSRIWNIFISTRGFTGHEHADGLGIIHMNGRIYDPKLGRFLQADPFVQNPKNSQSLNRYSYVLNNPLSYTDPSGYFSLKSFWKKIRPFVAIAVSIYMPGAFAALGGVWATAGGAASLASIAASGFVAGYVASGSINGALIGAFSAAVFYGIGSNFEQFRGTGSWGDAGLSGQAFAEKIAMHGLAGGVMTQLQGGKFGHGFAAAGFTQAFSGTIGSFKTPQGRIIAASVVAGTASVITGGKFANGALTGAFSRAFNEEQNHSARNSQSPNSDEWNLLQRVEPTGIASVDAGQVIAIEFRSDAFPPTERWYAEIAARPLSSDGTLTPVAAEQEWFVPVRYTVQTGQVGGYIGPTFVLDAGMPSPGGYRWYVRIPPQAVTHDNSSWKSVNVYGRRSD